jgi:hypothetical protein
MAANSGAADAEAVVVSAAPGAEEVAAEEVAAEAAAGNRDHPLENPRLRKHEDRLASRTQMIASPGPYLYAIDGRSPWCAFPHDHQEKCQMADSIEVENYKKSVKKITDTWSDEIAAAGKELDKAVAELQKLGVNDPLSEYTTLLKDKDPQKSKLAKQIQKSKQDIADATASLELNLKVIEPPPKAPENELVKLPDWVVDLVKKQTVKLSKYVTLKLDLSFDMKKRKVKKAGLVLTWKF